VRFSEETIEQVRQAVDLVELIGGQVALRKAGHAWKGLCPFHDEKTPSFTVNPDRQAYHCFGCGAGGDAFRFVMETDRLPFVEAVESLAERYGVTLPKAQEEDRAGRLHRALEEAQVFYRRALEDPETGRAARAYLAGRGLSQQVLEDYGVGYAPAGWDALTSRLTNSVGLAALLDAGLVIRREKGEGAYDRFRDRVLVPLRLPSGKVVGFGGRGMGDETPKYLNSPETAVYRKGKFLFGLVVLSLESGRPATATSSVRRNGLFLLPGANIAADQLLVGLKRAGHQKYPSCFFFSIEALPPSRSIARPCRSDVLVNSISATISSTVAASLSTAPDNG